MAQSRLASSSRLPPDHKDLRTVFDLVDQKVNSLAEGQISAKHNATTAAPTGTYSRGDFIPNSAPTSLGSAGVQYVILGWICVDDSTVVGVFKECRVLTGA